MATISGIFNDPFGAPLPGVLIEVTARKTTTVSMTGTNAAAVTAEDGSYSMSVLPGVYAVSAKIKNTPDYLGIIQVFSDSPDGTLNQYLTEFNPDDVTPEVLREMQLILIEARLAAESAWIAAEKAKQYALIPKGVFDLDEQYQRHDLVEYHGSEYLATADVYGVVPPASPWQLFVAAGGDGEPGPANSLSIGTVTTGAPDEPAAAEITGDAPNQTLNMTIPQGVPGEGGGSDNPITVDGIGSDESNNIQLNADSYCGRWQSGITYRRNNIVKATGEENITGQYVCIADTSDADPSTSNDWERTAGLAGAIDGLTASTSGNIEYNKTLIAANGNASPQCNGELTWTVNIDSATTVNLARFTDPSINSNPAAVLRLVITASDAYDVTFTGSSTYWVGAGSVDVPPVYSVDETQPLTIIEVSLAADGGVVVQQTYPASASTSPSIPAFEEPGASGFFAVSQAGHADPGTTFAASDLIYACVSDGSSAVGRLSVAPAAGTWELRGAVLGNGGNATSFVASLFTRIDQVSLAKGDMDGLSAIVRNLAYGATDKSVIRCELFFDGKWHPFSTSANDPTWWGKMIFDGAAAGEFDDVPVM